MPPVTHSYHTLPLRPHISRPTPLRTASSPTPFPLAQVCLKVLATIAGNSQRWVSVAPDSAPLPTSLKVLGIRTADTAWKFLARHGYIACHTTPTRRLVRLTPLGYLQATHYTPKGIPPAALTWLHRVLCHLYRTITP